MNRIFTHNWIAFVLFGWLAAWLISASKTDYLAAFSDTQLYMALAPLIVFGGFWSWTMAYASKKTGRWVIAICLTVLMVFMTQWIFFLYFEGLVNAHLFVFAYNADHLWIILPFILFVSCFGVAQYREGERDGRLFWRYGYVSILILIGSGMWNLRPPELESIDLDKIDPDAIDCCDAVYGQFVEANKLKELSTIPTIILTQQICEEDFGIVTTCELLYECSNACSNKKDQCRNDTPGPDCISKYWDCLSRCHKRAE